MTGLACGFREGQNMAQNAAHAVNQMQNCWLWRPVEPPQWVKDIRNGPQIVSLIDLSLFTGSLASRGLRSQKLCIYEYIREAHSRP